MDTKQLPVLALMGPTASGKSALAIAIAERFDVGIISVDSALVYRGMDVGTAKPSPQELARYPHHLIDIRRPCDAYSAAQFRCDALAAISAVYDAGRQPLLVGGTMLYFRALFEGLSELPSADAELRAELDAQARALGWPRMHQRLAEVDPLAAKRIHPNDPQRIQRALEVYLLTGTPMSELQFRERASASRFAYPLAKLVIAPVERSSLHARIEQRFHRMLEKGLLEEVAHLREDVGVTVDSSAMRAVGYRQVWRYLDGEYGFEVMKDRAVAATRQLAKRQLTWLRREADAKWFDSEDPAIEAKMLEFVRSNTI